MQQPSRDHEQKSDGGSVAAKAAIQKSSVRVRPVFLVWAPSSPRAEGLSSALGAELILLSYRFKRKWYTPVKYPLLLMKSISALKARRPRLIICQEPSPFCTISALLYRSLFERNARIIVDAHTADFEPPWSRLMAIHRKILGRASLVIVTNNGLKQRVMSRYSVKRCQVLADRVPATAERIRTDNDLSKPSRSSFKVAVVCSFAPDEPIREVIAAACLVPEATFYITGDSRHAEKFGVAPRGKNNDGNVVFTGYLPKSDYLSLLSDADAVMALTNRDDTMLSGAAEALGLARPLITSSWPALKEYFDRGTLYVDNSPGQIAAAVRRAMSNLPRLTEEIDELRLVKQQEWLQQFAEVRATLNAVAPDSGVLPATDRPVQAVSSGSDSSANGISGSEAT
ncbi:MAG: glycosyltransferase [Nitrososphaera sp.]|jgi:glycosyltransferase involved in cell wall biosynthesis